MSALSPKAKDMLALIQRTMDRPQDMEDGWCKVSGPIWRLFDDVPAELIERRQPRSDGKDGGYVRLSERGAILMKYLP